MQSQSPFELVKKLETHLIGHISSLDMYSLSRPLQKSLSIIKRQLADARLDIRDYELSETRQEQLHNAAEAKVRLDLVRTEILAVSQYDIFSAADVGHITAKIEQVADRLR